MTLPREADQDGCAREHNLQRCHVYNFSVQQTALLNASNALANLTSTNGAGSLATATVIHTNQNASSFYRLLGKSAP